MVIVKLFLKGNRQLRKHEQRIDYRALEPVIINHDVAS